MDLFIKQKILIMGLPGTGKTTLALALAARLGAVHYNADQVRRDVNKSLCFSMQDRLEQAQRMGRLCDMAVRAGHFAIADFVCPTPQTREAFGLDGTLVVFVDRIKEGRYADTNKLFVPPEDFDHRITPGASAEHWAEILAQDLLSQDLRRGAFLGASLSLLRLEKN